MGPVVVYTVAPLAGVLLYVLLLRSIHPVALRRHVSLPLFILFAHCGALLLIILSVAADAWSGMATLGFLYLVSIGVFVMAGLTRYTYLHRSDNVWYRYLFTGCMVYFIALALSFALAAMLD